MSSLIPGREITVLLRSPDGTKEFRTYLSLTGEISGFDMGKVRPRGDSDIVVGAVMIKTKGDKSSGGKPSDKEAEEVARRFLASNAELKRIVPLDAEPSFETDDDDQARTEVIGTQTLLRKKS